MKVCGVIPSRRKSDGGITQFYKNDPIYTVLEQLINKYGETMLKVQYHKLNGNDVTGWFRKSDVKAYKHGGLVDETGLAWLDGTPQKPETVLDAEDTKNLVDLKTYLKDLKAKNIELPENARWMEIAAGEGFVPQLTGALNIAERLAKLNDTIVPREQNITFGDTNINIDHVENYEDFCRQLKNDPKFARFMWDSTIGRTMGRNSLEMNRFR